MTVRDTFASIIFASILNSNDISEVEAAKMAFARVDQVMEVREAFSHDHIESLEKERQEIVDEIITKGVVREDWNTPNIMAWRFICDNNHYWESPFHYDKINDLYRDATGKTSIDPMSSPMCTAVRTGWMRHLGNGMYRMSDEYLALREQIGRPPNAWDCDVYEQMHHIGRYK
jgi:hypothetical protein